MPLTHCLPTGALQNGEIPVCNISDGTVTPIIPTGGVGSGTIRGIVIFLTGFDVGINTGQGIPPIVFGDTFTALLNILVADGWLFLAVPSNEWSSFGFGSSAVYNAVNLDPGFGSNYIAGTVHWAEHLIQYCHSKYPGMPVTFFGDSWGGFQTLQVASHLSSEILAAACHCPATWISSVNHLFTPPQNFGLINCLGLNFPSNGLAGVGTLPMAVGYGTNDEALGFAGTSTVASGFTTTAAAAVTTIPLVSSTGYVPTGPQITVLTTGGAGYACYEIGSISGNNLNGLTFLSGSGNVQVGSQVVQSPLQLILGSAPASVIPNKTTDTHEFGFNDSGQQLTSTPTPVALSSMGTLTVSDTTAMTGATGAMSIFASDNLWHVVNFSGSTATTFTGCTYSGTQSATVVNGSAICLSGNGSSAQFSYPYWFSTVVDPLAPRKF